nr:FAD-linked oxidoreductase StrQ [Stachybotrys sp.]
MRVQTRHAVLGAVALPSLVAGFHVSPNPVADSPVPRTAWPRYFETNVVSRTNLSAATVERELGPLLTNGSLIFGTCSPSYPDAIERWVSFVQPDIQVVVEPASESDVAVIVKYCNENNIDFLARSRGHGSTLSLNAFSGLQIDLRQLQGLEIQKDGQTVVLQAGVYAAPVVHTLWDAGYITVTGSCYCVGLGGLSLGGGHGRLQSLYGLVSDGYVHLNVVLADGSEVGVNATSHEDLFWALQGAGHNFGIVTSFQVKIYPRPTHTWHFRSYIWTQDKLETLFEELNKLHTSDNGTTPPLVAFEQGLLIMNTSISETEASNHPVLSWSFMYNGPAEDAEVYLQPFNDMGAVYEEAHDVEYPELAVLGGTDESGPSCINGPFVSSTLLLEKYNVTTQRALYHHFVQKVRENPELGTTARLAHQGYANAASRAIPWESTAYPHRDQNLILYFLAVVFDPAHLEAAEEWAREAWDLWAEGQDASYPRSYVNYAIGQPYETVESVYGYEPWRLERLRALKAGYDPNNRFRFYVPINPEVA